MKQSELQEQWLVMRSELEELGRLEKRKEEPEDSTGDPKDTIDIGVIFTQGRNKR